MASPVAQFELKTLIPIEVGGVDLSFTNSAAWMVLAIAGVTAFLTLSMSGRRLVPGRWQLMAELSYEFIANMVKDNVGSEGRKYFPFVFSLFMFILACNLFGMLPYSYTPTSQIIVTFAMAFVVFIGVTIIALARHGLHFFTFFFPSGAPVYMAPLLIPIEVISYFVRPVSLSVRLFANMMAGHTMLKVFGGFVIALGVFGVAPLALIVALTAFEILVAVLQAYVFTILTCLYLHDAIHLH
ncbi:MULTISPECIES: F0F1 ATP synthase subunit A [Nisaea]|uniref:ATP synthase subunit a n=1 Tax=Nisaea acidiphila TaxID=1862145 RepID=A0A9J7AYH3_9PROT|nr:MULTISPECIES: F0F1 ATP synthase subunit A [Nisaea]MBO6559320.1 F0F1 ATP synthase subunit A [Nisaea sp.]UUX51481.1 F0F1 ATP synthase subunit A [Nisaea acidiphila]